MLEKWLAPLGGVNEPAAMLLNLRGQGVIVSKADFFNSNGVVLIDDRYGIIGQELLEGVAGIQIWTSVAQIVQC